MMPFAGFDAVYTAIKKACVAAALIASARMTSGRNSTFIQDIFDLIFRAHVVISDFSGKNPNVMYETGIAHCLGRTVVPISQHKSDIPSDLGHHRACFISTTPRGWRTSKRS